MPARSRYAADGRPPSADENTGDRQHQQQQGAKKEAKCVPGKRLAGFRNTRRLTLKENRYRSGAARRRPRWATPNGHVAAAAVWPGLGGDTRRRHAEPGSGLVPRRGDEALRRRRHGIPDSPKAADTPKLNKSAPRNGMTRVSFSSPSVGVALVHVIRKTVRVFLTTFTSTIAI